MGQIVTLGDHFYELPNAPSTMEEVLYAKLPQHRQHWERDTDFPNVFYDYNPMTRINAQYTRYDDNTGLLLSMSREDTAEVIRLRDRELYRRWNGVFFMNDGELSYLTGSHYFQLQWGAIKDYENPYTGSKYGEYREYMRDYHYFRNMCLESTDKWGQRNCAAMLCVKPKKTAITNTEALIFLDEATRIRDKNFGMMSKTLDDVLDTGFSYFLYGLDNLPFVFRPALSTRNLQEVVFGNPRRQITGSMGSMMSQIESSKGFNTKVFAKGLKANAFDGPVMFRYWNDEWTKHNDPYPKEIFSKTSQTVKKQESIQGLGIWTAYVSETDSRDFKESKEIWEQSMMSTMDEETGRTKSEFFAFFIPADMAGETSFDIHGKANRAATLGRINARRKQLQTDLPALQSYMRQSPLTAEEAWREGGGSATLFNNMRISAQKQSLVMDLDRGVLPYVHGNLEWVIDFPMPLVERIKRGDCMVKFVETSDEEKMQGIQGPWRIYLKDKLPNEMFNRPLLLNMRDHRGWLKPGEDTAYVGATDPTEYAFKSNVKTPSMCASTLMNFHNSSRNSLFGEVVTKRFVSTYLMRRENPADMLEDIAKKILFWGCYEAIESNREWMYTALCEAGLQNFLLVRNAKTRGIEPYDPRVHKQQVLRTVNAGRVNVIEDYVKAKSAYYAEPTGDDPDYLKLMQDERILGQDMQFKVEDTRAYDMSVCSSWNILALESFTNYLVMVAGRRARSYTPEVMALVMDRLL